MGPLEETGFKTGVLYAVGDDGEYKEVMPIDNIEWEPVTNEEFYVTEHAEVGIVISHLREPITAMLTVIRPKMNRKKFKKWLMKYGFSRNEAEKMCCGLARCKGRVSYLNLQDYIYWIGMKGVEDDFNRTAD